MRPTRPLALICTAMASTAFAVASEPAPETSLRLPVAYQSPGTGLVSLALFDQHGVLVRSLLSAAPVAAGAREVIWDGTDDLGRSVAAGTYQPSGVFFTEKPALKWVMKVGKSGNPPWSTPDGTGNWGGNLGHPASICSNGSSAVLVWGCVEDHNTTGVQQMDADGGVQLRYHTFYPWDSRSASAMDATNLYVGILHWGSGLEIAEYTLGQPRGKILAKLPSKMVKTPIGRWKGREINNLDGLAITADRIYAAVAVTNELFVIERASGKILTQVAIPSPHGVAVAKDRLLVVSEDQVVTCTLDGVQTGVLVPKGRLKTPNAISVHADGTVFVGDSGRISIDIEWQGGTKQIHVFDATGKALRTIGKPGGAPRSGRFDSAALGDITGICIAPGGTSLMVTDVTTGFHRTSRWSLDGKLEKEWFCRKLETSSDRINPHRPDELVKVGGGFDDILNVQAWEMDLAKKTWRPGWRYTMPYANNWQDHTVVGFNHGGNPIKAAYGESWPMFGYGSEGGLTTHQGRNYMLSSEGAIYTYAPGDAPKLVAMPFPHRCERQGDKIQAFYDQGPNHWFAWADANGDQRVEMGEIILTSDPAALAGVRRVGLQFSGNGLDLTVATIDEKVAPVTAQAGRLGVLPLKELRADGAPVYDWSQFRIDAASPVYPDLSGGDGKKKVVYTLPASLIQTADATFALLEPACDRQLKLPGIDGDGWWAGRNWRKKIARFDRTTGRCLWAVGRRAPAVAEPGQMYCPISLAGVAGDAVFAADAMGVVWAWDTRGLYLGRLYHGPDDKKLDSEALNIELQSANVYVHPKDGKIYAAANDFGVSVHEVVLPKRVALTAPSITIDAAQAARAKPWDPDGVAPTEKPVARFHRVKRQVDIDGTLDGREGWYGSEDGTIKPERPMLVLLDGERVATVRGMYDATNLYLAYEVRAPNGPLNAGSELPYSPFTSGAYVDCLLAPDWTTPQRREARAGDVRVLAAQVREGAGTAAFHRAFWQVKPGGTNPQKITSPAASLTMDDIAEIPGLKQAWHIEGKEQDSERIRYAVELAIPLASLGIEGKSGATFGFDCSIAVANASGDRRERAAHWGGLSEAQVVDRPGSARLLPEHWGTVTLSP